MHGKRLKETLAAGGSVVGTFFHWTTNPAIVEMLPERCLDFVIVNVEHNALDLADFLGMQFALSLRGIACLARVHSRDPEDVARACDSFPDGVVIPYAENVPELRRLVAAAKYRPLKGVALERLIDHAEWPSAATRDYVTNKCANTFFAAMIESVRAVDDLDAICGIAGIDAVFIGPNDLSVSMGIPEERDHPAFVEMTARVIRTAARHGVAAGAHLSKPHHLKRMIEQGARFLPYGSDGRFIQNGILELANMARGRATTAETPEKVV